MQAYWPFQTLFSCSPCVGLTLESISSTIPRGGRRAWTVSIHWPARSASAERVFFAVSHRVSKRAHLARRGRTTRSRFAADDPAHRGIMPQTLGVVTSSYSARRPNPDCREGRTCEGLRL